jgi:hypothetical protein
VLLEKRYYFIGCCDLPAAVSISQAGYELVRRFYTDIVAYQRLFQLIEQGFVDISAQSEYRRERTGNFVARFAQPVFEISCCLSENSHDFFLNCSV